MRAGSLPELEAAAERHFRPGTTYSIFSVREETPAGVFLSYRAEAHPPGTPGKPSASRRTLPRGGGGGTEAGVGAVGEWRSGASAPGGGAVTGYNPETVDAIPEWLPQEIPARVLKGGPGLDTAFKLLQDPDLGLPPGPAFATDAPEFVSLLDRTAPTKGSGPSPSPGSGVGLLGESAVAGTDESLARRGTPGESGRPTVEYVGLLDDPVEAAEPCGYRRWSAAGVLNGGQPGADVLCFGLGDGSNVTRLAEGLHRYRPMRLILAVDASRKHADTQAWVHQVAQAVRPSSLVAVARTVTSSPTTVQELGYPVQYPG